MGGAAHRTGRGALRRRVHRPCAGRAPTGRRGLPDRHRRRGALPAARRRGGRRPALPPGRGGVACPGGGRGGGGAGEAAGDTDGLVVPGIGEVPPPCDEGLDNVVASVARASLDVLSHGVCDLFTRYVAEVSGLGSGGADDAEPTVDAETAVLLDAVSDDPTALSYLVASAALLTTEDRQALLAESATRRRLAAEARLLRRELTLLRTLGAVPVPLQQFAEPMTVN